VHYLIYIIVSGIGVHGDIIPNNYDDPVLGNLLECVQICGYKLLDLFLNLSRKEVIGKRESLNDLENACEGNSYVTTM